MKKYTNEELTENIINMLKEKTKKDYKKNHIKKVAGQVITQAQISKKYEISPSTLGKRYKDLKIS